MTIPTIEMPTPIAAKIADRWMLSKLPALNALHHETIGDDEAEDREDPGVRAVPPIGASGAANGRNLSGGEPRLLSMGRALATDPAVS